MFVVNEDQYHVCNDTPVDSILGINPIIYLFSVTSYGIFVESH